MTLDQQVALIDQLVKKEPDFTIKDYLELVEELDMIEGSNIKPEAKVVVVSFVKSRTICS